MNKVLIERSERKFKEVSEEIVIEIIDYWNSHEGFKKNTKTEKGISDIKRSFHKYDIEEFKKYIDRYYEITKETEYFFNYRWDLVTFVRHKDTKTRFNDEGTLWTPFLDWKQRKVKTEFKESEHIFIPNYNEVIEQLKEIPYSDYLLTEHWVYFSKRVKKYYDNKCMVCNSKDNIIDVHHRTYENRGREMYDDVILLCRICHAKFHDKNK